MAPELSPTPLNVQAWSKGVPYDEHIGIYLAVFKPDNRLRPTWKRCSGHDTNGLLREKRLVQDISRRERLTNRETYWLFCCRTVCIGTP
jgi:hypothetical protein